MEPWRKKEKEIIEGLGGRRMPGSGNQWFAKGDGDIPSFKLEVKTTEHSSFSLKKDVLQKIEKEALFAHKSPATIVDIQGYQCAVIPLKLFTAMVKCWEDAQGNPPP